MERPSLRMPVLLSVLLSAAALVSANPPEIVGIVNAASQTPPYLAGDELAPGSLLTILGSNFASGGRTTVAIGDSPLRVLQVSFDRIQARIPDAIPLGRAELTVTSAAEKSRAIPVILVASQFGLFSHIDEVLASGGRSTNSPANPAPPGSTMIFSGTGLGSSTSPEVLIAGRNAKVLSVTKAASDGGGSDEIKAVLPAGAPEGCFVPVQVRGAGRLPSNIVTVAIRRGDGWCEPPAYLPLAGRDSGSAGLMLVSRTVFHPPQGAATDFDEAGGFFVPLTEAESNPFLIAPPVGSCTVHVDNTAADSVPRPSLLALLMQYVLDPLDAGRLVNINDGRIQRGILARPALPGYFLSWLNDPSGRDSGGPLDKFMAPAQLQFAGKGGDAVGAFRLTVSGPAPFEWADGAAEIDRNQGFEAHWKGMGADRVALIVIAFQDRFSNTRGLTFCAAEAQSGAFRVPPEALAVLPAIPSDSTTARATRMIVSWPAHPEPFTAPGVDRAVGVSAFAESARVSLR